MQYSLFLLLHKRVIWIIENREVALSSVVVKKYLLNKKTERYKTFKIKKKRETWRISLMPETSNSLRGIKNDYLIEKKYRK